MRERESNNVDPQQLDALGKKLHLIPLTPPRSETTMLPGITEYQGCNKPPPPSPFTHKKVKIKPNSIICRQNHRGPSPKRSSNLPPSTSLNATTHPRSVTKPSSSPAAPMASDHTWSAVGPLTAHTSSSETSTLRPANPSLHSCAPSTHQGHSPTSLAT